MSVSLHIDELVVDGVAAADAEGLRAALTDELGILAAGAAAPPGGEIEAIDAGAVHIERGGGAEQFGRALARSIHGSVWRC